MATNSVGLAGVLADWAGADRSLPNGGTDPVREWVFPGHRAGTGQPVNRCIGVENLGGDDCRTKYTLYAGYGYHTDAWHCYPKDQWTEAEARAHYEGKNKPKV